MAGGDVAPEPQTARANGCMITMPDEPKKPGHPGLFPAALVFFGPVVMLGLGFLVTKLIELIRWIVP